MHHTQVYYGGVGEREPNGERPVLLHPHRRPDRIKVALEGQLVRVVVVHCCVEIAMVRY